MSSKERKDVWHVSMTIMVLPVPFLDFMSVSSLRECMFVPRISSAVIVSSTPVLSDPDDVPDGRVYLRWSHLTSDTVRAWKQSLIVEAKQVRDLFPV